jgi:hypothetical protein
MLKVAFAALAGIALADSFSFNKAEFHVWLSTGIVESIEDSDYFHLTGQLTEQGGTVIAQCANDTAIHKCSHSIGFGKEYSHTYKHRNVIQTFRNVSATIGGQSVVGVANFAIVKGQPKRCFGVEYKKGPNEAIYLETGPNPPPQCNSEYNRTGCEAFENHSCTWCASSDGVHQLCFEKTHAPSDTRAWSCDKVSKMTLEDTKVTLAVFV